jgi:hypothetical protein
MIGGGEVLGTQDVEPLKPGYLGVALILSCGNASPSSQEHGLSRRSQKSRLLELSEAP